MILWRLSSHAKLDGKGGMLQAGRWHTNPKPAIYAAESPPGALVEVLAGLDVEPGEIPNGYCLIGIDVGDKAAIHEIKSAALPANWKQDLAATRAIGDRWFIDGATPLLRVPSSIIDRTANVLVNPGQFPAGSLQLVYSRPFEFDPRLF